MFSTLLNFTAIYLATHNAIAPTHLHMSVMKLDDTMTHSVHPEKVEYLNPKSILVAI